MIRVVNETGAACDTLVLDENGERIEKQLMIEKLSISIKAEDVVRAEITALMHCDIKIDKANWILPRSAAAGGDKIVKLIYFTDGSVLDLSSGEPIWG